MTPNQPSPQQKVFEELVLHKLASAGVVPSTPQQAETVLGVVDRLLDQHYANLEASQMAAYAKSASALDRLANRLGVAAPAPAEQGRAAAVKEASDLLRQYPNLVDAFHQAAS